MIPLPLEFTRKGSLFRQLKREGRVALYSRGSPEKIDGYEVVIAKESPEHTWPNGNVTPPHETYPSDEAFGKRGWYFPLGERDRAEAKFAAVVAEISRPRRDPKPKR